MSGPPSQMTKPAIERVLKRSSSIGAAFGAGTDWSCGPQLALVNGVMIFGLSGNWTKDSIFELFLLENSMPRSEVPFRYRMVYLTESIWPGEQLLLYWDMMLVMVARSGRVWQLSQFNEPTYSCRALLRDWRSWVGRLMLGTESTGSPLR